MRPPSLQQFANRRHRNPISCSTNTVQSCDRPWSPTNLPEKEARLRSSVGLEDAAKYRRYHQLHFDIARWDHIDLQHEWHGIMHVALGILISLATDGSW